MALLVDALLVVAGVWAAAGIAHRARELTTRQTLTAGRWTL